MRKLKSNNEETKVINGKFNDENLKDLEVVELIKAGKSEAFDHIYNKYYPYLRHYCFNCIRNNYTAEDLTIEILTKVYMNISKYSKDYTLNAWIWKIARNHVVDYCRRQSKEPLNINRNFVIADRVNEDDLQISSIPIDKLPVDDKEVYLEKDLLKGKRELIKDLLNTMSERERLIITCYYFDEMSYKEIAAKLGLNLSLIKTTLFRAKDKLKDKIESLGFVGEAECISHLNFI